MLNVATFSVSAAIAVHERIAISVLAADRPHVSIGRCVKSVYASEGGAQISTSYDLSVDEAQLAHIALMNRCSNSQHRRAPLKQLRTGPVLAWDSSASSHLTAVCPCGTLVSMHSDSAHSASNQYTSSSPDESRHVSCAFRTTQPTPGMP